MAQEMLAVDHPPIFTVRKMKKQLLLTATILGLQATGAVAAPFTVDGNLSDWGINPIGAGSPSESLWLPTAGIKYSIEDQRWSTSTPNNNQSNVNSVPGQQNYDAEAIYAAISGSKAPV